MILKYQVFWILILAVIFTLLLTLLTQYLYNKKFLNTTNISKQGTISHELLTTMPLRMIYYTIFSSLLYLISKLGKLGELCSFNSIIENNLAGVDPDNVYNFIITLITILLYIFMAWCMKKPFMTKSCIEEFRIKEDTRAIVITLEMFQLVLMVGMKNLYITTCCLSCIFGKWFWISEGFCVSASNFKEKLKKFFTYEGTYSYGILYKIVFVITLFYYFATILLTILNFFKDEKFDTNSITFIVIVSLLLGTFLASILISLKYKKNKN